MSLLQSYNQKLGSIKEVQSYIDGFMPEHLKELEKAIEATEFSGLQTLGSDAFSGAPLKYESLDSGVRSLSYGMRNFRLFRYVPRQAVSSNVHQYNLLTRYDNRSIESMYSFVGENELNENSDAVYTRESVNIKFLQSFRSVTMVQQIVAKVISDQIATENRNGALSILKDANRALAFGNSRTQPLQYDGFYELHRRFNARELGGDIQYFNSDLVIDLRGEPIDQNAIADGSNIINSIGFGTATHFFAPNNVINDLVKGYQDFLRVLANTSAITDGIFGQRVRTIETQYGSVALETDTFLRKLPSRTTTFVGEGKAATTIPAAPATLTATPVAAGAANSKWAAGDAGDYFYAVTALTSDGESPLRVTAAAAAIAATGAVDLDIAPVVGATGYRIYRSNEGAANAAAATFSPLFEVDATQLSAGYNGAAAGSVRDLNIFLPGTDQAFLIQGDEGVWNNYILSDLFSHQIATVGPAYRWFISMFSAPGLPHYRRMVRYINIGSASS